MQAWTYPRRLAARLACRGAQPGALVWHPAPPTAGDPVRARLLARGVLLFDGRLVESTAALPWDLAPPDAVWSDHLHGHGWLDHAAAADDPRLWAHFEAWLWAWIDRYGDGSGPGWRADLVARRLTRWIGHAIRLLRGQPPERSRAFFRALSGHARYLAWCWRETAGGARIEALGGLVYAALALEGMATTADRAIRALGRAAGRVVRADGGIDSRNPEELARTLAVLSWSAQAIDEAGRAPAAAHLAAIRRATPVVRALTTPAGTLARFHGGRAGAELPPGTLVDRRACARAGAMPDAPDDAPDRSGGSGMMGYLRLAAGPASLIVDAAPPPRGRHGATAHASALGFELCIGRQPVIVSCGSGLGFGARADEAGRRAQAHSAVRIEAGAAPAGRRRAARAARGGVKAQLVQEPTSIAASLESSLDAARLGLVLNRHLQLARDGAHLAGMDVAHAPGLATRKRAAAPAGQRPAQLVARFHLHPDVSAKPALNGRAVVLSLPEGARWLMHVEADGVELAPSVYHDEARARPRATMQVVATSALVGYRAHIAWSLEPMEGARGAVLQAAAAAV